MSTLSKKKVIGITGSMGSGKSQVSKIISKYYPVLDCDQVNSQLLEVGNDGFTTLLENNLIELNNDGQLNKEALAKSMFSNVEVKNKVEMLLHPLIFKKMKEWIDAQDTDLVFVEMPLLFEIKAEKYFDSIWCVVCSHKIALERLKKYRNIEYEQANERLKHQLDPEIKKSKSDIVIENDKDINDLSIKIKEALERETAWN